MKTEKKEEFVFFCECVIVCGIKFLNLEDLCNCNSNLLLNWLIDYKLMVVALQ